MYKLLATIKKETIILLRDQFGLGILFLMPIVLIIVMTLIQDAAFSSINERGVDIVVVDNDKDSLGIAIIRGLQQSKLVVLHDSIGGSAATEESARQAVKDGEFLIGVIIPENASKNIRISVDNLIESTLGEGDNSRAPDSVNIRLLIDPVAKTTIVESILSNLREFISGIKTKVMFEAFSERIAEIIPDQEAKPQQTYERTQIISYTKEFTSSFGQNKVPTAVQHNVPAWTIFGMFFIVVAVVANIMNEKQEGSMFRLKTVPSSYFTLIIGKVTVFVTICILQFFAMMLVGIYLLPYLGLDSLDLGNNLTGVILLAVSTALAATGFGVLVGTLAKSQQQGAILGSLLVLLLSAFGGVWVPTYVMPESMRVISEFSPMNWSLAGFYELFLKGAETTDILWKVLKLVVFFIVAVALSIRIQISRK